MTLLTYTRTQLKAQIRQALQERTATLVKDTEIERWIDVALDDVAVNTFCLRAVASASCSATQQLYDLSATCLGPWSISRLEYDGRRLLPKEFGLIDEEMGGAKDKGLTSTGAPQVYFAYGRQIGLWPVPAENSKVLRYWYARHPETLSADAMSIIDLGFSVIHGPAVESFAAARGLAFKGKIQESQGAMQQNQMDLARASNKAMPDNTPAELTSSG